MAHHHDRLLLAIAREKGLELLVARLRTQCCVNHDLVLVAEFRGGDFRGLQGARQRAGDHNVELKTQRRERASYIVGLLLTRLVDGPLVVVPGGIVVVGTGMTQEVDVHDEYFALIVADSVSAASEAVVERRFSAASTPLR